MSGHPHLRLRRALLAALLTLTLLLIPLTAQVRTASAEREGGNARDPQPRAASQTGWHPLNFPAQKVETGLRQKLLAAPSKRGSFLVYLKDQADLSAAYTIDDWNARGKFVYDTLWATAQRSQADLRQFLGAQLRRGAATKVEPFYIVNAVMVNANVETLDAIAGRNDVAYIEAEQVYTLPPVIAADPISINAVEWGVSKIRADLVWSTYGVRGNGMVVANIDTGVLYTHAALVGKYRGNLGGGIYNHNYNWYDPTGTYPTAPGDNNGHGSHTMGTMVGDDGAGNQIGVAPQAKWIAAKGCASSSCASGSLLSAGQWVLAPYPIGGTPSMGDPTKRPNVVNNSWGGGGGNLWYQATVSSWVAANIFPAFSAGNSGPGAGTIGSPGDYPQSFASAATDSSDNIASFSSRGPSSLTPKIKPEVSAPGVSVRSSWNNGGYNTISGTSMASPHTAGCATLLRSARPSLTVEQTEDLMLMTAVDRGAVGPDMVYGYGRIDCYAAMGKLMLANVDVFLKDKPVDTGLEPDPATAGMNMWESEDIWVRLLADGGTTHQNPEFGQTNYVYARVRYRSGTAPANGALHLYYANASTGLAWPTNWTEFYIIPVTNLMPATSINVYAPWSPPGTGHYCLYARWISTQDAMTNAETANVNYNTRYNNNIVWKNVNVVDLQANVRVNTQYIVRNISPRATAIQMEIRPPRDELTRSFFSRANLTIDLGPELFKRWQDAGGGGSGFKIVGPTQIMVADPAGVVLKGIPMTMDEEFTIGATFESLDRPVTAVPATVAPANGTTATSEVYHIEMVQYDDTQTDPVGGVTYQIELPPLP